MKKIIVLIIMLGFIVGCSNRSDDKVIKVASHTEPMTTVVEIAGTVLEKEGYTVELVKVSDNVAANLALKNGEVDANFFQHQPYMESFNEANNANLVAIQPIYDALVGFYSKPYNNISELPKDATIAIPNDAVNQARALLILEDYGLISFKDGRNYNVTIKDVNDTTYEFIEVDLLTLTQAYEEVDLAFNYPTYIKAVGLTPKKDALLLEKNSENHYAISLVAREDNKASEKIKKLKEAMTSTDVYDFLTDEQNSQTLVPVFTTN